MDQFSDNILDFFRSQSCRILATNLVPRLEVDANFPPALLNQVEALDFFLLMVSNGTLQDGAGLFKRLLQPPTSGSGTDMAVRHSRLVFLQFGYSYRLVNGKPFKKLVPDPN